MSDDNPIPDILAKMQALGHIRLAHGVVGKTSIVAGIVFLVLGAVALRLPSESLFAFGIVLLLAFFIFVLAIMLFAHKHPEQALLEGAEIIHYRQQEMAAKGVPSPPSTPLTLNPTNPDQSGLQVPEDAP